MAYLVTARKWRPLRFDEIVGQEHITTTLKNALSSGRIASCYLFCGPRGVGKTTTARILAKALNCGLRQGPDPCGECPSCRSITEGTSLDVLEIDGASNNGVDDVRELREVVRYAATEGKYRIYIIDEVHMLSKGAFNALLKTLEEPPPHVVFVFATTEVQEVPDTILSRCQRFNFRRLPASQIAGHLEKIAAAEGLNTDPEALFLLARRADGSLRDAESLLDQVVAFAPEQVTTASAGQVLGLVDRSLYFGLLDALGQADPRRVLDVVAGVVDEGGDLEEFVHGFAEHLRHLLLARVQGKEAALEVAEAEQERYQAAAASMAVEDIVRMLQALLELGGQLRHSLQPRFRVELALVRLALMGQAVDLGQLLSRLERLNQGAEAGERPARASRGQAGAVVPSERAVAPPAGGTRRRTGAPAMEGAAGSLPPTEEQPQDRLSSAAPEPADAVEAPASEPPPPGSPAVAAVRSAPAGAVEAEGTPAILPDVAPGPLTAAPLAPVPSESLPAARPGPTEAAGPLPGEVDPAQVRKEWSELVQELRHVQPSVGLALQGAELAGVEGKVVRLGFAAGDRFHKGQVEKSRKVVEDLCLKRWGVPLRVMCVVQAETQAKSRQPDRPRHADPTIKSVLDAFDGELL